MRIAYQHYISDELIAGFENLGLDSHLQIEITKEKREEGYSNFAGAEVADIVVYIDEHTAELIVGGLLARLAYDAFKGALALLWNGISKLVIKRIQSGGRETDKPKSISLRLRTRARDIEVNLEGDVDPQEADKVIDAALQFIGSAELDEAFDNSEFIASPLAKPRIRLKFNKEAEAWEPENFEESRREIQAYLKAASKLSS